MKGGTRLSGVVRRDGEKERQGVGEGAEQRRCRPARGGLTGGTYTPEGSKEHPIHVEQEN